MEGGEEAAGRQQDGAHGEAAATLAHPLQVPLGEVSHADGPRGAVEELVPISVGGDEVAQCCQRLATPTPPLGFGQPNPMVLAFKSRGLCREET